MQKKLLALHLLYWVFVLTGFAVVKIDPAVKTYIDSLFPYKPNAVKEGQQCTITAPLPSSKS